MNCLFYILYNFIQVQVLFFTMRHWDVFQLILFGLAALDSVLEILTRTNSETLCRNAVAGEGDKWSRKSVISHKLKDTENLTCEP